MESVFNANFSYYAWFFLKVSTDKHVFCPNFESDAMVKNFALLFNFLKAIGEVKV
jgi:hypothetical protein